MDIWCKNNAYQVMTNTRKGRTDGAVLQLHAARGGHVSGQVLLRGLQPFTITGADVLWQGAAPAAASLWLQGVQVYNDGVPYPDRVEPMHICEVPSHRTQGVLVQMTVPAHAQPGRYFCKVVVHTSEGDQVASVQLHIRAVLMPDPASAVLDHEYFFTAVRLQRCIGDAPVGSETWWALMKKFAEAMKQLRINTLALQDNVFDLQAGLTRRVDRLHWNFDFSLVNEFIRRFFAWGSFRRICFGAPLQSLTGATISSFDEEGKAIKLPLRSEEGEAYGVQYLQALYKNLQEQGWVSISLTHIEDEPHESENWLFFRDLVRRYMPGIPCSDAMDEYDSAVALAGACDELVPRIDVYEQGADYFHRRRAAGDKVWCYSCCFPEQNWFLNKFIDLPARYSRMMYWAAFANGLTGFLHWGFAFWDSELYSLDPAARFKGDGFIVYPDAENQAVLHSNRGLATTQGAEEYELLCIAAERFPEEAKALATRLTRSFTDFDDDPELLEKLRVELFALCEL